MNNSFHQIFRGIYPLFDIVLRVQPSDADSLKPTRVTFEILSSSYQLR